MRTIDMVTEHASVTTSMQLDTALLRKDYCGMACCSLDCEGRLLTFHMDYGSAAAKYLDAFMQNIQWEEVERRYQHAVKFATL